MQPCSEDQMTKPKRKDEKKANKQLKEHNKNLLRKVVKIIQNS